MEIYLLRYFLSVVETGSFTRAAQACLITQPTLSAGIKRLEDDLGVALFVREKRRVFLTEAGTRFLPRAKAILHEVNMAQAEIGATEDTPVLRLGVLLTIPARITARLIHAVYSQTPDARLELYEGTEQELLNRLDERGIELALSLRRGEDDSLPLYTEPYTLALPSAHRLAARKSIAPAELAAEAMIVRSRCEVLSETSRHFTDRNVRPPFALRTPHDERALAMVGAGLGITVMPDSYRAENVVRIPMQGFDYRREVALFPPRYALPARLETIAQTVRVQALSVSTSGHS